MSLYETTIVIDSLQKADDIQSTVAKVESFIQNNGGTIVNKEEWGKKRLAYEINRKQYGNYYHMHFEGPATLPALMEREFRLEEAILRSLTIKADPATLKSAEETPEITEEKAAAPETEAPKAEAESEPKPETETETVAETEKPVDEEQPAVEADAEESVKE